jgi:hypothetical protein
VEEEDVIRQCRPCDVLWGTLGLLITVAVGYISIDLLAGGALTRAIAGRDETEGEPGA